MTKVVDDPFATGRYIMKYTEDLRGTPKFYPSCQCSKCIVVQSREQKHCQGDESKTIILTVYPKLRLVSTHFRIRTNADGSSHVLLESSAASKEERQSLVSMLSESTILFSTLSNIVADYVLWMRITEKSLFDYLDQHVTGTAILYDDDWIRITAIRVEDDDGTFVLESQTQVFV